MDKAASGDVKPVSNVQAQPAKITAQVVVRDKDGNVKYAGPLVMTQQGEPDGRNTLDRRS
jgi:hypothetical protein